MVLYVDREERIIWIISNNGYAIRGDWKSNKYVSEGRVNKIVGVWAKQILRLLERPEERGRIYFVDKSR